MPKHPEITRDLLYKLYIEEMNSYQMICDKLGISYGSLSYLLCKYNISKFDNGIPKIFGITKDELFNALYVEKLTNSELMKKFGICYHSIRVLCNYFGIPKRWDSLRSERAKYHDKIVDLYINKKLSIGKIAKLLELPKSAVRQILINADVTFRNKSESQMTEHFCDGITNWIQPKDNLRKRCRNFFSNHIVPAHKKDHCEICGSIKSLCVHHKIPFSVVIQQILSDNMDLDINKDEDKLYEIITSDERFLDPTNLITVCEYCHYTRFHPNGNYEKLRQSAAKPYRIKYKGSSETIETVAQEKDLSE